MTAVLFVGEQGSSALTYYRQHVPAAGLASLGWTVWKEPILVERSDHRLVGWRGAPFPYGPVPKVIIARHLTDPTGTEADTGTMFANARAAGQRVFYDLDDDLWHLPEHNPAKRIYGPQALAVLEINLSQVDGVLCSTFPLAAEVANHTDALVYVCPNGVEVSDFATHRPHDPRRLGWFAFTRWRHPDLLSIREPLRRAMAGSGAEFVHVGAGDDRGEPVETYLGVDWPTPVHEIGWVDFPKLRSVLCEIDVAIFPMEDNALNRSRSWSTGLTFAASGIPFVASPLPTYESFAARVPHVVLAETGEEWEAAVAGLLERAADDDWLAGAGAEMRVAVARHFNPRTVAQCWHDPLSAAIRRHPAGRR